MRRQIVVTTGLLGLLLAAGTYADDAVKTEMKAADAAEGKAKAAGHQMMKPGDMKWVDAPASLPKGAKVAILHGDPNAPGMFAMRIRMPANYKVMPHTHPADEYVTVISGVFNMGLGDTWDDTKGHALPAGSVSIMPVGTQHFAWSKTGAVVQIHAMGPWGITYINPSDDPRNKKEAAK